jgi:hypothetical protein
VWRLRPELLAALDRRFGEPTDAYVNGSQTWLRDDGPRGTTLEWRLHPVAGFVRPADIGVHELFESIAFSVANETRPAAPPDALWEGLEVFPAFPGAEGTAESLEPAELAACAASALGIEPDAYGLVDHDRIADRWEHTRGGISIVANLLTQLESPGR